MATIYEMGSIIKLMYCFATSISIYLDTLVSILRHDIMHFCSYALCFHDCIFK
jgi:hypothetical protein